MLEYVHVYWRPKEGDGFSGTGVAGNCGPPDMSTGKQTQALYESS